MEINKEEVAKRLKEWLISRFGSINEGARALGKTPENLRNSYLNGRSVPGGEILAQCIEYGCDIRWLLTGQTISEHMNEIIDKQNATIKVLEQEKAKLIEQLNKTTETLQGMQSLLNMMTGNTDDDTSGMSMTPG